MSMLREGKASGKHAKMYPDFCYQKRIDVPLLDFLVDCRYLGHMPGVVMTLFFVSNDYTPARENKKMLQIITNAPEGEYDKEIDEMLKEVFEYPGVSITLKRN